MSRKTKNEVVIDGKIEEEKPVAKVIENVTGGKANVRSIDELIGRRSASPSVGTLEDYEAKIKSMTKADLQKHATDVGLLPVDNKSVLTHRLVNEFKKKSRGYFNTAQFNTVEPKNKDQVIKATRYGTK